MTTNSVGAPWLWGNFDGTVTEVAQAPAMHHDEGPPPCDHPDVRPLGTDSVACTSCHAAGLATLWALHRRLLWDPPRFRPMRGQVVVREEIPPPSAVLWTPDAGPERTRTHRGVVLGLGPPARLTESPDSPEVPHGFEVGSIVQYHFEAMGTQEARTRAWPGDGLPATWLTQAEIDAVWEEEPSHDYATITITPEAYPLSIEVNDETAALLSSAEGVAP